MIELKEITEFDELINGAEEILVDFYADWCGPCKMLGIVLEEYQNDHPELKILRVNTDRFQGLARKYSIISIPSLKIFKNGEIIKEKLGFLRREELEAFIEGKE